MFWNLHPVQNPSTISSINNFFYKLRYLKVFFNNPVRNSQVLSGALVDVDLYWIQFFSNAEPSINRLGADGRKLLELVPRDKGRSTNHPSDAPNPL